MQKQRFWFHNPLMRRLALLLALAGLAVGLAACTDAPAAADPGYYTEFHHVDLDVETNGDVRVTETIKYVFQTRSIVSGRT